jgi:phospholipid/cholesterol/gamma-HCH transport system substrate-binding protein
MPIQNKARWAKLKVGVMAIAALVILGILIFLLTGNTNPFVPKAVLYTYMEDSAALAENAPVRLNGIVVGKVKKIALSGLNEPLKTIRMDLEIDNKFLPLIPVDSIAGIGVHQYHQGNEHAGGPLGRYHRRQKHERLQ